MQKQTTFPEILRNELNQRRAKNPRYSLRAFAQTLGISPSFLSKILAGKKSLGENTFLKLASRLSLPEDSVENLRSSLPGFKLAALSFTSLEADQFQSISDWHHYAILEAFTLHDSVATPEWMAEKLNISVAKAQAAMDRLRRLGYLKKDSKGNWDHHVDNHTTTHLPTPTLACREHERQVLQLALLALDQIPVTERDQSSMTLAIPQSRLKEAQKRIDEFRRDMTALLQRRGKRDSIYHLSVSFYPITNIENLKTKGESL
jgi:transcriptional regulator with XRE-family HTH domain